MSTASRRQRRHREMGSEGSPRQRPGPRHTNRIRGWAARMSRLRTVKSVTTKGLSGRCGGSGTKVAALIRGDLPGCRGDPTVTAARRGWTRQGSAEAMVPAGMDHAGKGRTSVRGSPRTDSWMRHRPQPSHPRGGPDAVVSGRDPQARRQSAASTRRPPRRSLTPPGARTCGRPSSHGRTWPGRWRRVERNGGAPGPDGMTTEALRSHLRAVSRQPVVGVHERHR